MLSSLLPFAALAISANLVHADLITEDEFFALSGQYTPGWSEAGEVPDLWVRYSGAHAWQNTAEPGSPYVFNLREKAGYRIENDEETEVVVQYLGDGIDGIKVHTERTSGTPYDADAIYEADIHITFIPPGSAEKASRRRDVFDEGDFEPLPFNTRTLTFRNDNEYDDCAGEMQLTAVATDANGETTTYTEINSLTIDIPDSYPFSVKLTHDQDEAYFTTFDFSNVTYQWVKGSSPQIGTITASESLKLLICGDQN